MARRATADSELVRMAVYEAFVDASHDALFSLDPEFRAEFWNRNAARAFGRHVEDAVGQPVAPLFPETTQPLLDAVQAGERADHVEVRAERSDGMAIPIALSLRTVRDHDGACLGFVGVARDLTEQRLAQAALAETESRLREAEALAHAGRWLWDVDSGAVQWSEEMHRIHGVDPARFEGTLEAHLAVVHDDDVDDVRTALLAAVGAGRAFDAQYRIVRGDGVERTVTARAEPSFGPGGRVIGLRGFAQDVTSHR